MNLSKRISVFLCLFLTFGAFSQLNGTFPSIHVFDKDTVIVFSISQGRKLAQINESNKSCQLISEIQQKQLLAKDSIIASMSQTNTNLNKILSQEKKINELHQETIQSYIDNEEIIQKQLKSQIRMKMASIIGGIATTGIFTFLYFTK